MTLLAQKILLVLVDALPDGSAVAPALDVVAASGCNGFLRVSASETTRSDLEILAGITRDGEDCSLAYPKLPLALFSTSQDACATAKAVDDEKKLVVVHVEHPVSPGHWLDALVAQLLPQREADGSGKFFVAVVQKCAGSKESPMHPFRPRQSFAKRDGAYAPGSDESATHRLLLAFVHHDHTRCDAVERFNAADVEAVGGGAYGTMSAHVWIKETAFRLGFAPKYGA